MPLKQAALMAYKNLPCGCKMRWDDEETVLVFCNYHTAEYVRWEGTDRDFVKKIATPKASNIDKRSLVEMQ
jgi:hypothetical protein